MPLNTEALPRLVFSALFPGAKLCNLLSCALFFATRVLAFLVRSNGSAQEHWFSFSLLQLIARLLEQGDYLIDVWSADNGLRSSVSPSPNLDGYLWIGTYNGLARFDGVRFVTFRPGQYSGTATRTRPAAQRRRQRHALDQYV